MGVESKGKKLTERVLKVCHLCLAKHGANQTKEQKMSELTAYEMAALRIKCMNLAAQTIEIKGIPEIVSKHEGLCLVADVFLDYALGSTEKTEDNRYTIKSKYPELKQSFR